MVNRVTIYGWVINHDPTRGWGSGTLVDLVYFVEDSVSVEDVFRIVRAAGYKIISKKIEGTKIHEKDRITVEDWNDHIKIGTERMTDTDFGGRSGYDRYNVPMG